MNSKFIYIAAFILAFLFTTLGIIYMNSAYNNIFKFDFSKPTIVQHVKTNAAPIALIGPVDKQKITQQFGKVLDTLRANSQKVKTLTDSIKVFATQDSSIQERLNMLENTLKTLDSVQPKNIVQNEAPKNTSKNSVDSTYLLWTKKTAALYESMDPKKAAKIIQNYSDNIAKDILYTMKKNKAADILSQLNPETATRITRVR